MNDKTPILPGPIPGLLRRGIPVTHIDGSRWVDADALRRVCLHVAGLEVTP